MLTREFFSRLACRTVVVLAAADTSVGGGDAVACSPDGRLRGNLWFRRRF